MNIETLFDGLSLGSIWIIIALPWLFLMYALLVKWGKGHKLFLIVTGIFFLWALSHFSFLSVGIIFALSIVNFILLRFFQANDKTLLLWGAFFLNLGALIVLKYLPANEVSEYTSMVDIGDFVGIVGISFYIFHVWSIFADLRARRINQPIRLLSFLSFLLYFPKIITGPLVRYEEFSQQLETAKSKVSDEPFLMGGVALILVGLLKKGVGDFISLYPMAVYANVSGYGGFEHILAMYGYALYIFLDFSAYTDMARGISRLFGIELPQNFASPYRSVSMGEFWRRWHITLSLWIRDYIYIPLGGSRFALWRTQANIMIAFILSGVWHGVGLGFAIWGFIHGLGVVVNKIGSQFIKTPYFIGWLITFHWVCLGWIFFANPFDHALIALDQIGYDFRWGGIEEVVTNNLLWVCVLILSFGYSLWDDRVVLWWQEKFIAVCFPVKIIFFVLVIAAMIASSSLGVNTFIYQNF